MWQCHPFIILSKYNIKVLYNARTKQGTQGAECIQTFRPNYLAPYKGLQGATAHTAATARNTSGRTPSLFGKCSGFFYMRNTTHRTIGFTPFLKDEAMVTCKSLA